MKYKLILASTLLFVPLLSLAHGETTDFDSVHSGMGLMQYVEDKALGSELHEEMEDLMTKMMNETLNEDEANRLITLMNQHPGPYGMMMNRLTDSDLSGNFPAAGFPMMMGYPGSFYSWGFQVIGLIWLVAGIMLIAFLWKKIANKS